LRLASRIDHHHPDVLALQAHVAAYVDGRHEEAIALIERALALNPNSARVLTVAGWVYVHAGQPETAVVHLRRATRLNRRNPLDFKQWAALAQALMQLGCDDEALDAGRQAVQRGPNDVSSWRALAAVLALTGRLEEAQTAMATLLRLAPDMSLTRMRSMPARSGAARARYFEGLRLAGMPQ
jgi:adenylate cyclase